MKYYRIYCADIAASCHEYALSIKNFGVNCKVLNTIKV